MKKTVLPLLLALLLLLSACGSAPAETKDAPEAEPDPLAAAAGEYTLFAVSYGESLVEAEALEFRSVLTLEQDGTGYLTINDDGGAVESWTLDGENAVIHSGVSTITGTLSDGVAVLDFGDDNTLCYARPDANLSGFTVLTGEEFIDLLLQEALGDAELPESAEGEAVELGEPEAPESPESEPLLALEPVEYKLYAIEYAGVCILNPELGVTDEMTIRLSEDGTGSYLTGGKAWPLRWSNEEGTMLVVDELGQTLDFQPRMVGEGVFTVTIELQGTPMTCYYFREGADVSAIPAISANQAFGAAP